MKLVAITGWGQLKDKEQTAAAGFDMHFVKPVDLAELVASLMRECQGGVAKRQ